MLRRLTRVVRNGLLLLGLLLLAWLPASFWIAAEMTLPWPAGGAGAAVRDGFVELWMLERRPLSYPLPFSVEAEWDRYHSGAAGQTASYAFWPHIAPSDSFFGETNLALPLWLVAALALAWPVTYLMAHRRVPGKGFAVEAARPGTQAEGIAAR